MSAGTEHGLRWRRAWWRTKIALALLPLIIAVDLLLTAAIWFVVAGLVVTAVSIACFVRLMIRPAPGEETVPLGRKRIALAAATSLVMAVAIVAITAALPAGDTREFATTRMVNGQSARATSSDRELGWAPQAPNGVVGQRLETVDPNRRRILFIGDSIVFGLHLRGEQAVTHQLELNMPGWQVLNAAVSGYSIDQYYLYLRRIIAQVNAELVIVGVFTGNDFQITGREFSWGGSKPLMTLRDGRLVRGNVGADCIDRLNRSVLIRALWRSRSVAQRGISLLCRPRRLQPLEQERVIARLFDAIDETAREANTPVMYVLLPERSEYSGADPVRLLYGSRHRTLLRLLEERPREIVDFAVQLAQRPDQSVLYFDDSSHFTAAGHVVLAQTLQDAITTRYPFAR